MTRALPAPARLELPGRVLLLVAGLPGAGKSTLLRGAPARPGLRILDSDAQRARLVRVFPGVGYPRLRPWVHLLHRLAVVGAACGTAPTVVVHLPATGAGLRRAVRALAALTGRDPHLLWIDAAPADAVAGQAARGRMIESRSFARHVTRAAGMADRIRGGSLDEGWASATAVERNG
jgi:hypothetical protein